MLKRIAVITAVLGAFSATATVAEPTLEGTPNALVSSASTASMAQPAARPEAFRPTAATTPDYNGAPWWPNSMAD